MYSNLTKRTVMISNYVYYVYVYLRGLEIELIHGNIVFNASTNC